MRLFDRLFGTDRELEDASRRLFLRGCLPSQYRWVTCEFAAEHGLNGVKHDPILQKVQIHVDELGGLRDLRSAQVDRDAPTVFAKLGIYR